MTHLAAEEGKLACGAEGARVFSCGTRIKSDASTFDTSTLVVATHRLHVSYLGSNGPNGESLVNSGFTFATTLWSRRTVFFRSCARELAH